MSNKEYTRDFKGVWIPKEIWLNRTLSMTLKCLLVEINSLDNDFGCVANNRHFAEFLDLDTSWVSQKITELKNLGYVFVSYENQNTKEGRVIRINKEKFFDFNTPLEKSIPPLRKSKGALEKSIPPLEKSIHNNTFNNPINITLTKEQLKIKEFKDQPVFEMNRSTKFSNLTDEQIELTLMTALVSEPNLKFSSAINWLEVEAKKQAKPEAPSKPQWKPHNQREKKIIYASHYTYKSQYKKAIEEAEQAGYIVSEVYNHHYDHFQPEPSNY